MGPSEYNCKEGGERREGGGEGKVRECWRMQGGYYTVVRLLKLCSVCLFHHSSFFWHTCLGSEELLFSVPAT